MIVLKVTFDKFYSLEDQGIVSDDEDLKNNETGWDRYWKEGFVGEKKEKERAGICVWLFNSTAQNSMEHVIAKRTPASRKK